MEQSELKKYLDDVMGREQALFIATQVLTDITQHIEKTLKQHEKDAIVAENTIKKQINRTYNEDIEEEDLTTRPRRPSPVDSPPHGLLGLLKGKQKKLYNQYLEELKRYNIEMSLLYEQKEEQKKAKIELLTAKELEAFKKRQCLLVTELCNKEDTIERFIKETQSILDILYARNVIYKKYRYLFAVSHFCEYIHSGRCYSLEGSDGAYNMYEADLEKYDQRLRDYIKIGKLNAITEKLDQIRGLNYMIYNSICESNQIQYSIRNELKSINISVADATKELSKIRVAVNVSTKSSAETSEITAYFAKETAKNSKLLVDIQRNEQG